ncbi:DUF4450 domain-containing protein [Marinilabilia salmonicolor]|uniref:Uncharacterized protein DUF4450 n=1 Tax=Marinilabilia salmonicolor TaxID=989 RepID=A0A368UYM6_9BACT|nr:DUF4450 domain-containing protein [Marinilabilia salmonicolor]RCW32534.1 uncharacterized protein DUF4450 [Marinilabilia salmonicolor]
MFKLRISKKTLVFTGLICFVAGLGATGPSSDTLSLWHGESRNIQYRPDGQDFVSVNGKNKFTRALYGTESDFRVETSDVPEFALYMPRMGGNIHFGLVRGKESIWVNDCDYIESRYRAGTRLYTVRDSILESGVIEIRALAMSDAEGMVLKMSFTDVPDDLELLTVYGGAANRRFHRSGDLGVDPQNSFELQNDYCEGNVYVVKDNAFEVFYGASEEENRNAANGGDIDGVKVIVGVLPVEALLREGDAHNRETPLAAWNAAKSDRYPVMLGKQKVQSGQTVYLSFSKPASKGGLHTAGLPRVFEEAEKSREALASRIQIDTPDPWINTLGGVLSVAGDGIWESPVYQHGAVGWRMPLSGWRGAYVADVLGWHDRARMHFNAYAHSQVTEVEPLYPHPTQDSTLNLSRALKKWGTQMYSNGYICRNPNRNNQMHHYDMNLCYIDELLWHFNWTGDLEYVKEMWPVIEAHLKWEKRNYDPDDDGLYDAYACIWASDALMYNSGGVTHSSAYNYRAHKTAARLAGLIGKEPEPYRREAQRIQKAIADHLWMDDLGWWAEYKDFMGHQRLHTSAAVWTIYQAIDADVSDAFQYHQATRYIDKEIPHIPVRAEGLDEELSTISTTNWMPYSWSVNIVAFAEVNHTALAYWLAGRPGEAYRLFKSAVMDGMYMGDSPGNIGQISFYDAARGECYRDFADPVGVTSRAVVQGLFGILPDVLHHRVVIKPGFPKAWDHASLTSPDLAFSYQQKVMADSYEVKLNFPLALAPELHLPVRYSRVNEVLVNGKKGSWMIDEDAVGRPTMVVECPPTLEATIEIRWSGHPVDAAPAEITTARGDEVEILTGGEVEELHDPQHVLTDFHVSGNKITGKVVGKVGPRTLFVKVRDQSLSWWQPVYIDVSTPLLVETVNEESAPLQLRVSNNSNKAFKGRMMVNPGRQSYKVPLQLAPAASSAVLTIPGEFVVKGSNKVKVFSHNGVGMDTVVVNWALPASTGKNTLVDLSRQFNDKVTRIFENEYLTPRSPYTTLQLPSQGIGEWCHPLMTAYIDDSGFRESLQNNIFHASQGFEFKSETDSIRDNIAFTSLWDNYPDSLIVPLKGKASHAYLLMTGSTNHMQSRFVNGVVRVDYEDGTSERLHLVNPDTWCPLEQDYYVDGAAFYIDTPAPYRVQLKTGKVSRNLGADLNIKGAEPRRIEGGAAVILDLPLDNRKELKQLILETTANDVVIGLMGVTLVE